jgi:hypothetical protein
MVEPASPTAGVDIRRDYALRTGAVSAGIDPESGQVASQRPWRRWPSWMRHRDHDIALLVPLLDVLKGLGDSL